MEQERPTVLEEQIASAKKSWLILYPVDVTVTAYFAFLILGVASAYVAGKNYLEVSDMGAAFGSFSLATIFIIISFLFGWGTTHTEKTLHMDEKKGNDYVVITLIVLTGIIAAGARYIHTQKTEYTNAVEYLSKHNEEYKTYMRQLENKYGPDDAGATQAMKEMREDYISSQTSAGDKYRTFYEIPLALILAVSINFCFGIMVSKYYKLRRRQESLAPVTDTVTKRPKNRGVTDDLGVTLHATDTVTKPKTKPQVAPASAKVKMGFGGVTDTATNGAIVNKILDLWDSETHNKSEIARQVQRSRTYVINVLKENDRS